MKKKIEKDTEIIIGKQIIERAIENLKGEDIFKKMKQKKANEIMHKHW